MLQWDIGFMSVHMSVHPKNRWCLAQAKPASHISIYRYSVPIICTIIVYVQHTFQFDLNFIVDPVQGHKNI